MMFKTRWAWSAFSSVMRFAAMRSLMPGAKLIAPAKPAEAASSLSTKDDISRINSPR
jgi:hypothetical protein